MLKLVKIKVEDLEAEEAAEEAVVDVIVGVTADLADVMINQERNDFQVLEKVLETEVTEDVQIVIQNQNDILQILNQVHLASKDLDAQDEEIKHLAKTSNK